jgi:hypothetical protein
MGLYLLFLLPGKSLARRIKKVTRGGCDMALIEMIRKSLLASLGAAVVTKEKVEEATNVWWKMGRSQGMRLKNWQTTWWKVANISGTRFRKK